jgi:integrase
VTRRRRSYVAHPRHPLTGRQFRVAASSPRALARLLAHVDELREGLRLGSRSPVDVDRQLRRLTHGPITLARAVDAYAARVELSEHTRRRVRSWIAGPARPLRDRELDDLDAPALATWLQRLRAGGAASSTVGLAWRTLRGVVRFAAERGWVGRSPWGAWRPSPRVVASGPGAGVRVLRECCRDAGELAALLDAARAIAPELEAKIATAAGLGLRASELAALRWSDLTPSGGGVLVTIRGKGGRVDELEGPMTLCALLRTHMVRLQREGLYAPAGPCFPDRRTSTPGHPRKHARGAITRRELAAAVAGAELPHPERWTPHSLRDSFATIEHGRHGGDLAALMARTRHASVSSLARYLRPRVRAPQPQLPA